MQSLRWRYVWRDLWLHKARTLLVILSITIGIFAFGIISGTAYTLSTMLPVEYQAVHPASITLHSTFFDDEQVESILRMRGVAVAEGRHNTTVRYLDGDGEWHDMRLFALGDYDDNQVNMVRPSLGAWPPPDRQILVERNSLGLTAMTVGDTVQVETSNGQRRLIPIAGLAHDMNQAPAQITGVPYGYVTRDTMEWLGLSRDFNEMQILVVSDLLDKDAISDVAHAAADKMEESGYTVFWTQVPEPGEHFVEQFLPTILLILTGLGILALILSAFLVVNVIMAILTQNMRQIGVMKAIGASPRQITTLYLRMVFTFGFCALLLAIPLGGVGASIFSRFVAGQLNFDLAGVKLAPSVLLLQIGIGLLTPLLAALFPIRRGARLTVREAIQEHGLDTGAGGEGRMDRTLRRVQGRLPISRPMRLSLRNTFRRKGRLVRTLIPLMLGGAIFMTVLTVRTSLFNTLEETLTSQGFDIQIQFDRPYRLQRLADSVAPIPGIVALEGWTLRQGVPVHADGTEGESVRVYALPADTRIFEPDMIEGRWLKADDGNAIVVPSSFLSDEPDVARSRELTLRIGDEETEWNVIGVNQVFQPPIAPPVLYVSQDYFWDLLGDYGHTDTVRALTAEHDPVTHARITLAMEEALNADDIEIQSTRSASEDRDILTERFNIITVILMVMAFLLASVGSLGLLGTMSINVLERRREIGVMRAIGASTHAILRIFVVEGVIIGLLSWFGALILSQPMSRLMSRQVGMIFAQLPLSYVYAAGAPLLWLAIVFLVSALASLLPARNAAGVSVRESLTYE